jgi:hypothetical protein
MEWQFIVALAVGIPIILLPAAFVWYLNVGGVYHAAKRLAARRAAREAERRAKVATAQANGADRKRSNFWDLIVPP